MNLCKNIWLRLVMKSKPYLSTFTHIYPYTMMRIKTPAGFSIPTTPKSEKSEKAIDSDDHLFSENENASQTLDSIQLIESLRKSILSQPSSPEHSSPQATPSASQLFSGMELPESLRSFLSQTQTQTQTTSKKRSQPGSPKHKTKSPKRSRKNSLSSAVVKPASTIEWDDNEIVLYGREKVFSFSGYQLRMISLLGILYAANRILQFPLLARDFELYSYIQLFIQ